MDAVEGGACCVGRLVRTRMIGMMFAAIFPSPPFPTEQAENPGMADDLIELILVAAWRERMSDDLGRRCRRGMDVAQAELSERALGEREVFTGHLGGYRYTGYIKLVFDGLP